MKTLLHLATLLLSALALPAHETWLQATSTTATLGTEIHLQLTSAGGFKDFGSGPRPERVNKSLLRIAGETLPLPFGPHTETFLGFTARPDTTGLALFAVELKPRDLELKPEQIEEYFAEIHAGPEVRAAWAAMPAPRRWRERYTKSATTFVRVGQPEPADATWSQPVGLALEIVPRRDPTRLQSGDLLQVRLLQHGRPLAGVPVGFVARDETRRHTVTTDAEGLAAAPLDHPGLWLIHTTHLMRAIEADLEWESRFSTLIVEVAPAPPLPDN